jgi:hypothetical protein
MSNSHHRRLTSIVAVALATLLGAHVVTRAGSLNPPAGPVTETGVSTEEIANLISGADPCMCQGLTWNNLSISSAQTLVSPGTTIYLKRITITKSIPTAEVYVSLWEPTGLNFGYYRLRPDEGSISADVDLVMNGFGVSSLSVSAGSVAISYTYKVIN